MTDKEILEGNKLIAEIMGGKVKNNIFICNETTHTHNERCLHNYNIAHAKYHLSWDWLMPVVEKIEEMPFEVFIWTRGARISMYEDSVPEEWIDVYFDDIHVHGGSIFKLSKIQSTYIAVVKFIKWHNEFQRTVS